MRMKTQLQRRSFGKTGSVLSGKVVYPAMSIPEHFPSPVRRWEIAIPDKRNDYSGVL